MYKEDTSSEIQFLNITNCLEQISEELYLKYLKVDLRKINRNNV